MTEAEIRAAVFAALVDYDSLKKEKRFKQVKTTIKGTVLATVIGSTGVLTANSDKISRSGSNAGQQASVSMLSTPKQAGHSLQRQFVASAALFGLDEHQLNEANKARLKAMARQLPTSAIVSIVGRADSVGGLAYNQKLSEKRAASVQRYLSKLGIKVKNVSGEVSDYKPDSWMQRRADLIIEHTEAGQVAINMPPVLDLYASPEITNQAKVNAGLMLDPGRDLKGAMRATANGYPPNMLVASDEQNSGQVAAKALKSAAAEAPLKISAKAHRVKGVAHFAINQAELTTAHKDRLDSFRHQLPKHAVLTVIGRTDATGEPTTNHRLGKLRALAVAQYLASKGVKVASTAVKIANARDDGWEARRVDVLINHKSAGVRKSIKLPPLAQQKAKIQNNALVEKVQASSSAPKSVDLTQGSTTAPKTGQPVKNLDKSVQAMDPVKFKASLPPGYDNPYWWDEQTKVSGARLDKTSWSGKAGSNSRKF